VGSTNILTQEVSGYLPDADVDAPVQLKELVTKKALSVMLKIRPSQDWMCSGRSRPTKASMPAPCLIKTLKTWFPVSKSGVSPRDRPGERYPSHRSRCRRSWKVSLRNTLHVGTAPGSFSILYDVSAMVNTAVPAVIDIITRKLSFRLRMNWPEGLCTHSSPSPIPNFGLYESLHIPFEAEHHLA